MYTSVLVLVLCTYTCSPSIVLRPNRVMSIIVCTLTSSTPIILRPNPVLSMTDKSSRGSFYNSSDPSSIPAPHYRRIRLEIALARSYWVSNLTVYVQFYSDLAASSTLSLEGYSSVNLTRSEHRFNEIEDTCKVLDWTYGKVLPEECSLYGVEQCGRFDVAIHKYLDAVVFTFNNDLLSLMFERIEIQADNDGDQLHDYTRSLAEPVQGLRVLRASGEEPPYSKHRHRQPTWYRCSGKLYDGQLEVAKGQPVVFLYRAGGSLNLYLEEMSIVDTLVMYFEEKVGVVRVFLDTPTPAVCESRHTLLSVSYAKRVHYTCRSRYRAQTVTLKYDGPASGIGIYEVTLTGRSGYQATGGRGSWTGLSFRMTALCLVLLLFAVLVCLVNRYNSTDDATTNNRRSVDCETDGWWSSLEQQPATAAASLALTNSCTVCQAEPNKTNRTKRFSKYSPLYIEAGKSSTDYDDITRSYFGLHKHAAKHSLRRGSPSKHPVAIDSHPTGTSQSNIEQNTTSDTRDKVSISERESPDNVISANISTPGSTYHQVKIVESDHSIGIPVTKIIYIDESDED